MHCGVTKSGCYTMVHIKIHKMLKVLFFSRLSQNFRKAIILFVKSVCLSVSLSIGPCIGLSIFPSVFPSLRPHRVTRLPLDGFSRNLIFEHFFFENL